MDQKKKPELENLPNKAIASSPERHTFQKNNYVKRQEEQGLEPLEEYIEMFKTWKQQDEENLVDPEWQKDNMEYDLRSTKWICDKVKSSDNYAQNLYAAMCNMQFIKLAVIPILKDQRWSASWRHSGGIIADMRQEGDYIDWYCSGIGNEEYGNGLDGTKPKVDSDGREYVPESYVTEEIRADLQKLGWIPVPWDDDET
jgi:hypothetical protein